MKTLVITIRCEVFALSTETAVLRRTNVEVVGHIALKQNNIDTLIDILYICQGNRVYGNNQLQPTLTYCKIPRDTAVRMRKEGGQS